MCLAVFALDAHPRYRAVIVANRDEFHARATERAHWWSEGWLAGRDLAAGGTWLGVTRTGRWALLTNIRDPARHDPSAPSRGALVTTLLADPRPAADAIPRIAAAGARHNGFNLVGGDGGRAAWGTNRGPGARDLSPGLHGLSNHVLDTPWPKVVRTKAAVAAWCAAGEHGEGSLEPLFAALADRSVAAGADLPDTGVPLERERLLSAPFIVSADYGTRCSTVATLGRDGEARFVERSFDPAGHEAGTVDIRFRLAATP
jgi:uncharacterized protein with NRDE domain